MEKNILQYRITDMAQLRHIKSNTSNDLFICVDKFMQNRILSGTRIAVNHKLLGNLFTYVIHPEGQLVPHVLTYKDILNEQQVLDQLKVFGFYAYWESNPEITESQFDILKELYTRGYDRIRNVTIYKVDDPETKEIYTMAFKVDNVDRRIVGDLEVCESHLLKYLMNKDVELVHKYSPVSKENWDWVKELYSIPDLIIQLENGYGVDEKEPELEVPDPDEPVLEVPDVEDPGPNENTDPEIPEVVDTVEPIEGSEVLDFEAVTDDE